MTLVHSKVFKLIVVLFALVVVVVAAFFLGDKHGLENLSITRITPTQAADAMKNDHFYASYRENTLIIRGTVQSVGHQNGDVIVSFSTSSSYAAGCDFGKTALNFHVGSTITALTEGATALRQPAAILLKGCVIP